VTQCLGALAPARPWFLVVAAPSAGGLAEPPKIEDLRAFRVPHGVLLRLRAGAWHAGPLFDAADAGGGKGEGAEGGEEGLEGGAEGGGAGARGGGMDFVNLELADTNVVDHNTHDYGAAAGLRLEVVD
jgi:hypothetical protein